MQAPRPSSQVFGERQYAATPGAIAVVAPHELLADSEQLVVPGREVGIKPLPLGAGSPYKAGLSPAQLMTVATPVPDAAHENE